MSALQNCQLCFECATFPFLSWLFSPPSVSSLSPVLCSTRGHGHGNAGVEQGRGSGLGQKRDKNSWLCVCHTPAPLGRCSRSCTRPAASQGSEAGQGSGVAHVQQDVEAKKVWEQRVRERNGEKAPRENGAEVGNRRTWVSLEEMQRMQAVITALST